VESKTIQILFGVENNGISTVYDDVILHENNVSRYAGYGDRS
jgi:hypothetical protein